MGKIMNNTTDNFAQQNTKMNADELIQGKDSHSRYTFGSGIIVNFPNGLPLDNNEDDYSEAPDMTKQQWNKYYKKLGLA